MTCGHHPCRAVEYGAEVVSTPQLRLAGRESHPHGQLQCPLRRHRRVDGGTRRSERSTHPVAGVFEQRTAMTSYGLPQYLVVRGQRRAHPLGVSLPTPCRTFDVGEQERDDTRWRVHASSARARSICAKAYVTMAALVMFRPVRAKDSYSSAPSTSRRWAMAPVVSG